MITCASRYYDCDKKNDINSYSNEPIDFLEWLWEAQKDLKEVVPDIPGFINFCSCNSENAIDFMDGTAFQIYIIDLPERKRIRLDIYFNCEENEEFKQEIEWS